MNVVLAEITFILGIQASDTPLEAAIVGILQAHFLAEALAFYIPEFIPGINTGAIHVAIQVKGSELM